MSDDSPCVGLCEIDPDSDRCIGCGRTSAEIFGEPEPQTVHDAELVEEKIVVSGEATDD
ncbi:MAG: DUF1289 domain-containing protein [Zoogloeaceae bacterium]|nr:DUF1289 domain-containing protein [Rhodocyclaceae bacterium]MCP5236832.1 DUF1289 domain-containing protein [Zoogloeaceae bacterium]